LDKQFVRDYLESTDWDKESPPPPLPPSIIDQTSKMYFEIYRLLTGKDEL
jgi:phosphoribosylaminoimidazole-succinocarboxamide synthase